MHLVLECSARLHARIARMLCLPDLSRWSSTVPLAHGPRSQACIILRILIPLPIVASRFRQWSLSMGTSPLSTIRHVCPQLNPDGLCAMGY